MTIQEEIKQIRNKIIYYVLAWFEDEGDYQPTQKEAEKAVDDILASALQHMQSAEREKIAEGVAKLILKYPDLKKEIASILYFEKL